MQTAVRRALPPVRILSLAIASCTLAPQVHTEFFKNSSPPFARDADELRLIVSYALTIW